MKKWDIIIIAILLIISFVPEIIFTMTLDRNYDYTYAEISIDGEIYKTVMLSKHKGSDKYIVENKYGKNIILVKEEKIAIIEADCPDKICMKPGYIYKPGQSLVCLPNRLYIKINERTKNMDEIDVKSY